MTGRADGEDAVEPARHDVAREPARQPDDVDVRRRERLGERLARLVRQEADAVRAQLAGERDELGAPRAAADDRDAEVVEIVQQRRRADERVEILRVPDVAGVHDDEPAVEAVLPRPRVVARRAA